MPYEDFSAHIRKNLSGFSNVKNMAYLLGFVDLSESDVPEQLQEDYMTMIKDTFKNARQNELLFRLIKFIGQKQFNKKFLQEERKTYIKLLIRYYNDQSFTANHLRKSSENIDHMFVDGIGLGASVLGLIQYHSKIVADNNQMKKYKTPSIGSFEAFVNRPIAGIRRRPVHDQS